MDQSFSARDDLDHILHRWWLIAVMMVLGAGIGWVTARLWAPVYEAHSVLAVNIDFTRTGQLTDVEEDYAIGSVGDLIQSPQVLQSLIQAAQNAGLTLDPQVLAKNLALERQNSAFYLRVRDGDPQTSARLANLWSQQSLLALTEAAAHARQANNLQAYQDALVKCVDRTAADRPVNVLCERSTLSQIQEDLRAAGDQVTTEMNQAHGILPYTLFTSGSEAQEPTTPIRNNQGLLMLCGAVTMLILSIWLIISHLDDRLLGKLHHD